MCEEFVFRTVKDQQEHEKEDMPFKSSKEPHKVQIEHVGLPKFILNKFNSTLTVSWSVSQLVLI